MCLSDTRCSLDLLSSAHLTSNKHSVERYVERLLPPTKPELRIGGSYMCRNDLQCLRLLLLKTCACLLNLWTVSRDRGHCF